jgi:hypothetical protein
MYYKDITVKAGDFKTVYKLLDGYRGAYNRTIKENRIAELMMPDWARSGAWNLVILLEAKDGSLYILSGTNRICAASDYAPAAGYPTTTFHAKILEESKGEVSDDDNDKTHPYGTLRYITWVSNRHVLNQTTEQEMEEWQATSAWVAEAKMMGLVPSFSPEYTMQFVWPAIIKADLLKRNLEAGRSLDSKFYPKRGQILRHFIDAPIIDIRRTLKVLEWWEREFSIPALSNRILTDRNQNPRRHDLMAFALLIHDESTNSAKAIQELPQRLLTSPNLKSMVPHNAYSYRELFDGLLYISNYRRSPKHSLRVLHGLGTYR